MPASSLSPASAPSSSSGPGAAGAPAAPRTRRRRGLQLLAACVVLLGVAGYLATQYATSGTGPARCTVRAGGGGGEGARATYEVKPGQASNAATIEAVASSRRLPERAVTIALATAMQESGLRNIDHGDRDSLGLFQQRPSQGWGSAEQILDPVYSAGKFYDHLVEVPGYSRLPLTVAAQKVQRSGYPQAYAKHEANASLLTAALTGRSAAALNCTTGPGGPDGTPGDPAAVRERLVREFGEGVLLGGPDSVPAGGGDGGGRNRPDRVVTVPAPTGQRGWELAHWAMAHAAGLRIEQISYGGRVWDAGRSEEGWRTEDGAAAGADGGPAVALRLASGA